MVGVSSSRYGLPSFGPEDAVPFIEVTRAPPTASTAGSDPADQITGVCLGRHDAHLDRRRARIDTHGCLLRHRFWPMYQATPRPGPVGALNGHGPSRTRPKI